MNSSRALRRFAPRWVAMGDEVICCVDDFTQLPCRPCHKPQESSESTFDEQLWPQKA